MSEIEPIIFKEGKMKILDQTKLPLAEEYLEIIDRKKYNIFILLVISIKI